MSLAASVLDQRHEIAQIVARESAETLVGRHCGWRVELLRRLIKPVANQVADRFVRYDQALGGVGMLRGSAWIVDNATGGLRATGQDRVPARGPVLVVANHPGLSDAVALLTALGREDAWIVAANYPFLHAMRLASRRFVFVSDVGPERLGAFRRIAARLKRGDAVIVFPAGGLEVDPAVSPAGAVASLARWSRSTEVLARAVRETIVVPAAIRGVVSRSAFDHPLARRRAAHKDRQRMATLLQLAVAAHRRNEVTVSIGMPLMGCLRDLHEAVIEQMRALIGVM